MESVSVNNSFENFVKEKKQVEGMWDQGKTVFFVLFFWSETLDHD